MLDVILVLFLDHVVIDMKDGMFPVSSNFEFCFVDYHGYGFVVGKETACSLEPFAVCGHFGRHGRILLGYRSGNVMSHDQSCDH